MLPLISVKNLKYRYAARSVDIVYADFSVSLGEAYWLSGASGAGKSTLLHILAGVLKLPATSAGSVFVDGRDVSQLPQMALDAQRPLTVGWLPQRHHLLPILTVLENLLLPLRLCGSVDAKTSLDRAYECLERLNMRELAHCRANTLSVGQAARVSLARAVIASPKVLLLDEPTAALDSESAAYAARMLADYLKTGGALIVASHDTMTSEQFAQEGVLLKKIDAMSFNRAEEIERLSK